MHYCLYLVNCFIVRRTSCHMSYALLLQSQILLECTIDILPDQKDRDNEVDVQTTQVTHTDAISAHCTYVIYV